MKCPKCGEKINNNWAAAELGKVGGTASARSRMAGETAAQTSERMRLTSMARFDRAMAEAKTVVNDAKKTLDNLRAENDADIKRTGGHIKNLDSKKGGADR